MHPFPPGTKVQTNLEYNNRFGRKVIGVSIVMNPAPPEGITIIRWLFQKGHIIPEHQRMAVMMLSRDLEMYNAKKIKLRRRMK